MKIREAISLIRIGLKELHVDSNMPNMYYWNKLQAKSSLFMQRESDGLELSRVQRLHQILSCIKMEQAPLIDDCCGVKSCYTVMRSSYEIPPIYSDSHGVIIKRLTTLDESKEIKLVTPQQLLRMKKDTNSKYDKQIYAFYRNNRIYLVNKKYPVLKMEAMFKYDLDTIPKYDCGEQIRSCVKLIDTEWIIPSKLEDIIINTIIQEILQGYKQIPADPNINNKDGN